MQEELGEKRTEKSFWVVIDVVYSAFMISAVAWTPKYELLIIVPTKHVGSHYVCLQVALFRERLVALVAGERLLASVAPLVFHNVGRVPRQEAARAAEVHSVISAAGAPVPHVHPSGVTHDRFLNKEKSGSVTSVSAQKR
jgi:hypothetical protein